jgi:hypothetical protein
MLKELQANWASFKDTTMKKKIPKVKHTGDEAFG